MIINDEFLGLFETHLFFLTVSFILTAVENNWLKGVGVALYGQMVVTKVLNESLQ